MNGGADLGLFVGRLHPVLVHLPIGLIVLLAFLELLARSRRFRNANANAGYVLALAVPMAGLTALCGWFLSRGGGYEAGLLQWHKWTGIGTAVVAALAALLYSLDLKKAYRACLFASLLVLVIASHNGGSLTHGSDYLVRYAPQPLRNLFASDRKSPPPAPDATASPLFVSVVQPILQDHCAACHGPEKAKGGLRLDTFAVLLKGGENGPGLVAGKPAESLILQRLRLPLEDEDHMPPEGKPQPDPEEIALLEWWITGGASEEKTIAQLQPPAEIAKILNARRTPSPSPDALPVPPKPLAAVLPEAEKLSDELRVSITALGQQEPWLQCNASLAGQAFGDAELAMLAPVAANLRWLDLAGTKVTDAGLAAIASMQNLTRLHLERTGITDEGLACVARIQSLEYLNLYDTDITDEGLDALRGLPRLKQLYLWQTEVTPEAADALVAGKTDKDQLARWEREIAELQSRIRAAQMTVHLGAPAAPASTNPVPINAGCPVSGKPVDSSKTALYQGKLVAFCCDDCKARFEKDPKAFESKLGLAMPKKKKKKA